MLLYQLVIHACIQGVCVCVGGGEGGGEGKYQMPMTGDMLDCTIVEFYLN